LQIERLITSIFAKEEYKDGALSLSAKEVFKSSLTSKQPSVSHYPSFNRAVSFVRCKSRKFISTISQANSLT